MPSELSIFPKLNLIACLTEDLLSTLPETADMGETLAARFAGDCAAVCLHSWWQSFGLQGTAYIDGRRKTRAGRAKHLGRQEGRGEGCRDRRQRESTGRAGLYDTACKAGADPLYLCFSRRQQR